MRKKLILFSFLFLCSILTQASNTLVTATVTDTNGQAYSYGFVTATFRPTPNVPGPYTVNGASFTKTLTASLDASGSFTITLTDNHTIQPANSKWAFTVCSSASVQCFDANVDVTGANQDLSATLSTASTPIGSISALPGLSRAYANSQISGGFGTIYYNILNNVIRVNNGSLTAPNWQDVGGGSGTDCSSAVSDEVLFINVATCTGTNDFTYANGEINLGGNTDGGELYVAQTGFTSFTDITGGQINAYNDFGGTGITAVSDGNGTTTSVGGDIQAIGGTTHAVALILEAHASGGNAVGLDIYSGTSGSVNTIGIDVETLSGVGNKIGVDIEDQGLTQIALRTGSGLVLHRDTVQILPNAFAFVDVPVCAAGTEGSLRPVNNSNTAAWGANVAAGGANHILAYCDGTNWTVAAK